MNTVKEIKIETELWQQLDILAEKTNRKTNWLIRKILESYIESKKNNF